MLRTHSKRWNSRNGRAWISDDGWRLVLTLLATMSMQAVGVGSSNASDGVIEISHTCAIARGCMPGDTPGYPVTLAAPGSYILTSSLIVPDTGTDGIEVNANSVSIDLNGFGVMGAACVGTNADCTPAAGLGRGIDLGPVQVDLTVRNGNIVGMGSFGIDGGIGSAVVNVEARWNAGTGIYVGQGSVVEGSQAYGNGGFGILTGLGSKVSGNAVRLNGLDGIRTSPGSIITGNTVGDNSASGISASSGSVVVGNTVFDNGGSGIHAIADSLVHRNVSRNNGGVGLSIHSAAYRENLVSGNTGGTVVGTGPIDLGSNVCNGVPTCP